MSESPFPFMDVSVSTNRGQHAKRPHHSRVISTDILRAGVPCRHEQQSGDCRNVHDPTHPQCLHFSQRTGRCVSSGLVFGKRSSSALLVLVPQGWFHPSITAAELLNILTHYRSPTSAHPFRSTRSCFLSQSSSSSP
jgi:hypothetical protein